MKALLASRRASMCGVLRTLPRLRHAQDRRGFTLIEVMAAVMILAIALLSLLRANEQTLLLQGRAQNITTASLLAQEKISEILIDPAALAESEEGDFGERFPYWRWSMENEEIDLPYDFDALQASEAGGTGTGAGSSALANDTLPTIQQVTLTIFWPEGNGEAELTVVEYVADIPRFEGGPPSVPGSSQLSSPATSEQGSDMPHDGQ